jgi:hypothetical protein
MTRLIPVYVTFQINVTASGTGLFRNLQRKSASKRAMTYSAVVGAIMLDKKYSLQRYHQVGFLTDRSACYAAASKTTQLPRYTEPIVSP